VDLRRLRAGEWIAGVSGAALVVALFLPWYGAKGTSATATAWEALAVNDAILLLIALFAVALWAAAATQRTAAVPVALASLTALLGLVATILVVVRLVWEPVLGGGIVDGSGGTTREVGIWLALAASFGIFLGAFRAMGDERTPGEVAPKIEPTPLSPPEPDAGR
jgi:hypothetical protein